MKNKKKNNLCVRLLAFLSIILVVILVCVPSYANVTHSNNDSTSVYSSFIDFNLRANSFVGGFYDNYFFSSVSVGGSLDNGIGGYGSIEYFIADPLAFSSVYRGSPLYLNSSYEWFPNKEVIDWSFFDDGNVYGLIYSTPNGVIYNYDSVVAESFPQYSNIQVGALIPYEIEDYTNDYKFVVDLEYTEYIWGDDYSNVTTERVYHSLDSVTSELLVVDDIYDSGIYEFSSLDCSFDIYSWLSTKISSFDGFVFSDLVISFRCVPSFDSSNISSYYPVDDNDYVRDGYIGFVTSTEKIPLYYTEFYSPNVDSSVYSDSIVRLFGTAGNNGEISTDVNVVGFLGTSINSILSIELFPGFSFGTVFYVILGLGLLFLFLRYFAGG